MDVVTVVLIVGGGLVVWQLVKAARKNGGDSASDAGGDDSGGDWPDFDYGDSDSGDGGGGD